MNLILNERLSPCGELAPKIMRVSCCQCEGIASTTSITTCCESMPHRFELRALGIAMAFVFLATSSIAKGQSDASALEGVLVGTQHCLLRVES
jgi:hypothetical protein